MGKLNLAILLSGGGTTFQYIQEQILAGKLDAQIQVVISSSAEAHGVERAKNFGIPCTVIDRKQLKKQHGDNAVIELNNAMLNTLEKYPVDLVVCAGFMSFLTPPFIDRFRDRIINTHPALIPAFCGQDMYGRHVHEAAVDYGVKVSGSTIHFVDEHYDHGAIIMQTTVPVHHDDTPETLARRVQAAEKPAFCEVIQLIAEGRVSVDGRKVIIAEK